MRDAALLANRRRRKQNVMRRLRREFRTSRSHTPITVVDDFTSITNGLTFDFIQDRLLNGRSFRGLTMMDEFSRVDLALELNYSFPSTCVIDVLDDVA
jgi:hypothetical protein